MSSTPTHRCGHHPDMCGHSDVYHCLHASFLSNFLVSLRFFLIFPTYCHLKGSLSSFTSCAIEVKLDHFEVIHSCSWPLLYVNLFIHYLLARQRLSFQMRFIRKQWSPVLPFETNDLPTIQPLTELEVMIMHGVCVPLSKNFCLHGSKLIPGPFHNVDVQCMGGDSNDICLVGTIISLN